MIDISILNRTFNSSSFAQMSCCSSFQKISQDGENKLTSGEKSNNWVQNELPNWKMQ